MNVKKLKLIPSWLTFGSDSATITLTRPSDVNGLKVDQLTLRAPTLREVRASDAIGGADAVLCEVTLFASLSDAGTKDIDGLKLTDYARVQTAYSQLLLDAGLPDKEGEMPTWLVVGPDGAVVTLSKPYDFKDMKLDRLMLRAPTVRDVRAATSASNGDDDQRDTVLLANLSESDTKDLEGLKLTDYQRLQAAYFRLVQDDGV
ncbi:phage tail assembly protein [Pseudomonas fluorescens]|uniref:Phage tail assembly protein n=2 Tax=Pseudomonas fluorescens TaxID=294 RepID=A0A7Z6MW53_PSEFL|nr:phage tail assembly protein [Pseudomonas fluorescens]RDS89454.1 phage tail assembly protein [Pseudomonas fluorescens]